MYKENAAGKTWVNPKTGEEYELSHLKGFQTSFEVKLGENIENVDVRVEFANHCYTKKQEEGEKEPIVCIEKRRDGTKEERVFCPKRWEFSKLLPDIITGLNYKTCLQGNSHEIVYRQEKSNNLGGHDGWYICMKLDYKSNRTPSLELWVRSAHFRPNRPNDVRGGLTKFCILLSKYLKSK